MSVQPLVLTRSLPKVKSELSVVIKGTYSYHVWGTVKRPCPSAPRTLEKRHAARTHSILAYIRATKASLFCCKEQYTQRTAFRLPHIFASDDSNRHDDKGTQVERWIDISYVQFHADVELYAAHWARTLTLEGIPQQSVIGLWLSGMTYIDVLHIYGIARANYVPQLISLRLPNAGIVYELLGRSHARALIYDFSRDVALSDTLCPFPDYPATAVVPSAPVYTSLLPPLSDMVPDPDDVVMIFHTSGSTSGSPKLVPCTLRWLNGMIYKASIIHRPADPHKQAVLAWLGSMCHIGQTVTLLGVMQHGSCMIQPLTLPFPATELKNMVSRGGLNHLTQFASFVTTHLRASREDAGLLKLLIGLDELFVCGLALDAEDEEWALRNGMKLRSVFGSTECGPMLASVDIGDAREGSMALRPIEGTSYAFVPIACPSPSSPQAENRLDASAEDLVQLVIRPDSIDCPHPSLRAPDGHFYTGDLFLPVLAADGSRAYVFRGRDDDWIKTANALRCDTKAIEENVRALCADVVNDCVVVGTGRSSPALFVEPHGAAAEVDEERVRVDVITRTRQFHARRYLHERITDGKFVVIVPKGSLPRTATKGNIRRKVVESVYKELLDNLYAHV